jgi:ABC-type Zn uptake system ZnuABC Zn-binding protein ZnuA
MIKREGIKAVFTEPQLARRPAEVVAEAGGVPVFEIDPLGGVPGKMRYEELIRSNAKVLNEALQ